MATGPAFVVSVRSATSDVRADQLMPGRSVIRFVIRIVEQRLP